MLNWLNNLDTDEKVIAEAKKLDWCQLSEIIMQLEVKVHNYSESLPLRLYNKFTKTIEILEDEKSLRVVAAYSYQRHLSLGGISQLSDSEVDAEY